MMNVMMSLRCTFFYILTAHTCGASPCPPEDILCENIYKSLDDDDPSLVLMQSQATKVTQADEMDDLLLKEIESRLFEESPRHTAVKILYNRGSRKIKAVESEEVMQTPEASISLEEDDPSLALLQTQATKVTKADKTTESVMELLSLEEEFLGHSKVKVLQHRGSRKVKAGDCEMGLSNDSDMPGLSLLQTQAVQVMGAQESGDIGEESTTEKKAKISTETEALSEVDTATEVNTTSSSLNSVDATSGSSISGETGTMDEVGTTSDSNISSNTYDAV